MRRRTLRLGAGLSMLAGVAAFVGLIAWQGIGELGAAVASAGWGIALVIAFHLVPTAAAAAGWRVLVLARGTGVAAPVFLWARMLREAVNGLMPVAQVGGNVVGARVLIVHGCAALAAAAGTVADVTVEALAQAAFTIFGLGILLALGGGPLGLAAASSTVAVVLLAGLPLAQRRGLLRLFERAIVALSDRLAAPALAGLAGLHDETMAIYGDRGAMVRAAFWHLATWGSDVVELWIVFRILGVQLAAGEALVIESLAQAIRSAAFLVPGALGVQEGAYVLLALHFGIDADTALAASLVKRVRDLGLGLPAILCWQAIEGRRLLGSRAE